MTRSIHNTVQDNLVRILKDQGYNVKRGARVGKNNVDVFAENEYEIRIYEVVISSDRLKEFDDSQFPKPVRVFKVYPNLRKSFQKRHRKGHGWTSMTVRTEEKKELAALKEKLNLSSYSDVIAHLIEKNGYE